MNDNETKAFHKENEKENIIRDNSKNILICEDKNKNFKENTTLAPYEENDINPLNKDINMVEKNLPSFLMKT